MLKWVTGHCEVLKDYSKLWHVDDLWTPVVALLTIYSDKYPYKITISCPYNLHFHVQPPFFLFLSLFLLNSHISKLTSCNFSPLINTPISVMIFTHFSINLAMSIKKQPINIFQLKWLLKLKKINVHYICVLHK